MTAGDLAELSSDVGLIKDGGGKGTLKKRIMKGGIILTWNYFLGRGVSFKTLFWKPLPPPVGHNKRLLPNFYLITPSLAIETQTAFWQKSTMRFFLYCSVHPDYFFFFFFFFQLFTRLLFTSSSATYNGCHSTMYSFLCCRQKGNMQLKTSGNWQPYSRIT